MKSMRTAWRKTKRMRAAQMRTSSKRATNPREKMDYLRTGSGGFFVSSPNNDCEGAIDSMIGGSGPIDPQAPCGIGSNDGNKDHAQ
jgi:hypothetical protein